jgi:excisionase family DNA binding protein
MGKNEKLLTVAEAATKLAYSTETVRRLIKAGRIPAAVLPSGQYRIKASVLDSMLQPVER